MWGRRVSGCGAVSTYPDLAELLGRQEDLDPELACCETQSAIGPVIKHPLLFAVPYVPAMNAMINQAFRAKRAAVEEAQNSRRWEHYLWLHERPYRVWAFARIAGQLDDRDYWEQLGRLWTDSENIFEAEALWLRLLTDPARLACRALMMTGEERAHLAGLPDRITVYRGYSQPGRGNGMSWTLSRDVARRFALRFTVDTRGRIARREVDKCDVIAYFGGRGEQEIVLAPRRQRAKSRAA